MKKTIYGVASLLLLIFGLLKMMTSYAFHSTFAFGPPWTVIERFLQDPDFPIALGSRIMGSALLYTRKAGFKNND